MPARLPPARTRFFGRADERDAVHAALADGARLVTLLGPPGSGKSRLALEVARELDDALEVRWCSLGAAQGADDAVAALAAALDLELAARADHAAALLAVAGALAAAGVELLVLDDVEQLLPELRAVVEACLDGAAALAVLATSRERLGVEGERCLDVAPLPQGDAAALYLERARAAGASLDDGEAEVVGELVARLDGIPLAIELAAARARVLAPGRMLERLDQRLSLLRSRGAEVIALDEAIRASWDRLAPDEQRALAGTSVFAGGFSLEAAEGVLDVPGVVDVIESLVDRSLLVAQRGEGGDVRFSLYENIRAFAAARLEELVRSDEVRERHARWFAGEADRRVVPMRVTQPAEVLAWLSAERDNLLAVVRAAPSTSARATAALKIALAMHQLLRERGPAAVQLEMVAAAARAAPLVDDAALRAAFDGLVVVVERDERGFERSISSLAEVKNRLRATGNAWLEAEAARAAAELLFLQGRQDDALAALEESERIYLAHGAREAVTQVRATRAHVLTSKGALDEARALLSATVVEAEALALPRVAARAHYRLGLLAQQGGDVDDARARYLLALAVLEEARGQDAALEGGVNHKLGVLHHHAGDVDEAVARFERALALHEASGSAWHTGATLAVLAAAKADAGELDPAVKLARRAEATMAAPGPPGDGFAAAWLGAVECRRGDLGAARAAFERAHASLDGRGDRFDRALLEVLEAHLAVAEGLRSAGEARARVAPLADLGISPRYAFAFLERSLDGRDAGVERRPAKRAALVVADDGRWFQGPGRARVDVAKKRVLRRLLAALVERRRSTPGRPLERAELLEAGWPGERMRPDSALSRLYVSIASLRRFGLEDVLLTAGDGYMLDPETDVVIAPAR